MKEISKEMAAFIIYIAVTILIIGYFDIGSSENGVPEVKECEN